MEDTINTSNNIASCAVSVQPVVYARVMEKHLNFCISSFKVNFTSLAIEYMRLATVYRDKLSCSKILTLSRHNILIISIIQSYKIALIKWFWMFLYFSATTKLARTMFSCSDVRLVKIICWLKRFFLNLLIVLPLHRPVNES